MKKYGKFTWAIHILAALSVSITMACSGGCASKTDKAPTNEIQTPAEAAQTTEEEAIIKEAASEPPLNEVTDIPQEDPVLRLVIISDVNGRYGSDQYDAEVVRAIDMIIEEKPDLVINTGDMVAGQKPKLDYRKMWVGFHNTVTNRLKEAGIPMAQVCGNHDGSAYPKYAKEREIYIDEWNQHKPELDYVDDSHYPLYYTFTKNGFYFVAVDGTTLDPIDDEQYAWLEAQLSNNPTQHAPIVFFHVPLFPITTIKPTEILRDSRLPVLFSEKGVQLVMTGHQQAYFPAKLNGVTYLHVGALGGGPRPVRQNDGIAPKTMTFVNLYEHAPLHIETHLIEEGVDKPFNHNLLPTYIVFGTQILPRVDISLEDAEFARDYMISPHMSKAQMKTLIEALKANGGDWGKIPNWTADE